MAKLHKDTDFLYASSRVRVLERSLLNRERVERMLDSKTLEEAVKVLYECEYADAGQEVAPSMYEVLLSNEYQKTLALLVKLAPEVVPLFLFQYDYLNLKIVLKAEFLASEEEPDFAPVTQINVSKLSQSVRERTFDGFTPIMKKGAFEAIEAFGKTTDPQIIDLILDRACYEDMMATAQSFADTFLLDYVRREIDLANIKSFVRVKRQGGGRDIFQKVFIDNGTLSLSLLLSKFEDEFTSFAQGLSHTVYGNLLESAVGHVNAGALGSFEKLCDDFRISQIKEARYVAFGPEPIIGYMVAKENDIKNARIILAGKSAGLSVDKLAERVRETYV